MCLSASLEARGSQLVGPGEDDLKTDPLLEYPVLGNKKRGFSLCLSAPMFGLGGLMTPEAAGRDLARRWRILS